jgi:hypothetical protein
MIKLNLTSIIPQVVIVILIALLMTSTACAELTIESIEISYQVEHSDRIAIGAVTDIQRFYDHSIITIDVAEWLMNPLPTDTIKIRTEIGTNVDTEDEARFILNEIAILMLKDSDLESNIFRVTVGEPGKHPFSDKNAIIEEISLFQSNTSDEYEIDDEYLGGSGLSQEEAMSLSIEYASIQNIKIGELKNTEIVDNAWYFTFEGEEYPEEFMVAEENVNGVEHRTIGGNSRNSSEYTGTIIAISMPGVFFASMIFLAYYGKRAIEEPDTRKNYILFVMLGIVTFFLSGYILQGIHPPESIYMMFFVYSILFATLILATRIRSRKFVAKSFAISLAALILISGLFFAMGAYSHINSKTIHADLLQEEPNNFIVITEEELNQYPALKETISTGKAVDVKAREWERTEDLLNGTYDIQYNGKYYGIGFTTA